MPKRSDEFYQGKYHRPEVVERVRLLLKDLSLRSRKDPGNESLAAQVKILKVYKEMLCRAYDISKPHLIPFHEPWLANPELFLQWAMRRKLTRLIRLDKHFGYFPSNIETGERAKQ